MTINPQRYTRKPLYVDAVQVTLENMHEVAEWCGGEVTDEGAVNDDGSPKAYIKVRVIHPQPRSREGWAYVGYWVLKTDSGVKVYTNKAFKKAFIASPEDRPAPYVKKMAGPRITEKVVKNVEFADASA